jgi:hypothetical protein
MFARPCTKVAPGAANAGKKRRRGVSGPAPAPKEQAAAAVSPFAALLQLLAGLYTRPLCSSTGAIYRHQLHP